MRCARAVKGLETEERGVSRVVAVFVKFRTNRCLNTLAMRIRVTSQNNCLRHLLTFFFVNSAAQHLVPLFETSCIVLLAVSCVAQRLLREFDG